MSKTKRSTRAGSLAEVCAALERLAPAGLAQTWDNVGLIAGDLEAAVRRVLCCIDLTPPVVAEAIDGRFDLVVAYHPPIFKPVPSLRCPSGGTDEAVFRCIRAGIAIYSTHTALDAADGGTNDVIASLCGAERTEPLEYVEEPSPAEYKLVTFAPSTAVDGVADALAAAGAGRIGDYTRCSFRLEGNGTFFGGAGTDPVVGRRGRLERVPEVRLEMVVPAGALPAAVRALVAAHPYEEPAFDIYPLQSRPARGIGRVGLLPRGLKLRTLAERLRSGTKAAHVQMVGRPAQLVRRVVVVVGAAGSLPFRLDLSADDAVITGEIRHHDALTIRRRGCSAVALGHWASERPVLPSFARRLAEALPGMRVAVSRGDADPFVVL